MTRLRKGFHVYSFVLDFIFNTILKITYIKYLTLFSDRNINKWVKSGVNIKKKKIKIVRSLLKWITV